MVALLVLMMIGGLAIAAVTGAVVLRTLLWLVLLPLRIVFGILLLPFLLLKLIVGALAFVIVGPLLGVFAVIGAVLGVVVLAAVALPFTPLLVLAFVAWLLLRQQRTTALVR